MSTYYCGIDLHAKNSVLGVIDDAGHPVDEAKLPNDLEKILDFLSPYGPDLHIAIESTINWYWIVDGLQEAGYDVHLAHTLGLYMITGAKVKTDRRDAFKLAAKYLRLDELPEAYIYPSDQRPLRDLLRRRIGLVEVRAGCYTSLRIQLMRYNLNTLNGQELKQLTVEDINALPLPGESQEKQGNRYLKWAFTQAANRAVCYYAPCRKFRDKHANRRSGSAAILVANCILAHKLATATCHMLKEDTPFEMSRLFG